ncbi:hypothetical protein JCM6882_004644 [Rhodosporidiobolus microsporus]
MLSSLATAALLVAATAPAARALSSHSPRDLEAHPAFAVVLSEHHLLNETLPDVLSSPLEAPPHSSPPSRHLLRTPNGQAFLCTVPAVTDEAKKRADLRAEADALIQAEEKERGVLHGVALLEPMRQGCLYQKQGWFTYSFCYGSEIRQFHEIRLPNSPGPSEDPQSDSYTLGVAPEPVSASGDPKYGSGSPALRAKMDADMIIPSRLGGGEGGGWDEGGRYLSQTWDMGTVCDKTGLPRTVEVQYHCNTQTIDHIALIRETSICRYVLLVHTPRLCSEPLFLDGHLRNQEPPATIECQPVVKKLQEQLGEGDTAAGGGEATLGAVASHAEEGQGEKAPPHPEPATPPHVDHSSDPDAPPLRGPDTAGEVDRSVDAADFDSDSDSSDSAVSVAFDNLDTLVSFLYDPETGEVRSAVTDEGEEVWPGGVEGGLRELLKKAGGVEVPEEEEPEEGRGEAEVKSGETEGGGKKAEKVEKENEELTKTLEELAKLMHDTLADALRGNAPPADPNAPQQVVINPALGQGQGAENDAVAAFIRAVAQGRQAGDAAAGGEKTMDGKGVQPEKAMLKFPKYVGTAAGVRNEAHEKLRAGFERRYDQEDGEKEGSKKGARKKDEL